LAKTHSTFICRNCGYQSSSWSGRCSNCGEWNTFEESVTAEPSRNTVSTVSHLRTQSLKDAVSKDAIRLKTSIEEVDNVFGGGIVEGSVNLLAGQPGIGKSTLLLQLAHEVSKKVSVLYISAEESAHQVGLRASRLGTTKTDLNLANTTSANEIAAAIATSEYKLVIVDSIQAISHDAVLSAAGSVSQITNSTNLITSAAKNSSTAVVLVGHVTKEGSIAGPKVLEHVVDVVIQLEGDRYGGFKILRAVKNRYGSTSETGILEMSDIGLRSVDNPSAALLEERQIADGSVVLATMEGSRPLLVEVQALVNKSNYGYPKRTASGIDLNRLNLLVAMLEKRTKLNLADHDIYINIVGGLRVSEPAADLAVCMAIGSASKGLQLKQNAVVFGELGLSGETRHVPFIEKRAAEAKKLGFDAVIGPKLKGSTKISSYHAVSDVRTALNQFLEKD
jgi:DNA repair protein RadA/Sms